MGADLLGRSARSRLVLFRRGGLRSGGVRLDDHVLLEPLVDERRVADHITVLVDELDLVSVLVKVDVLDLLITRIEALGLFPLRGLL